MKAIILYCSGDTELPYILIHLITFKSHILSSNRINTVREDTSNSA